ncbi:MAG: dihydroorotase [Bacteroidetes bacterium]|nr:dihydroorotase [Bacteroidota bacterium]MBS1974068.1 dihydroorotase [Bacteroidota bacterium]
MNILIQQARIIDPLSPYNGSVKDIFIDNGTIKKIQDNIDSLADKIIKRPGLYVSEGWADPFSNFCDPGLEYKETLESGAAAAAAGGFTDVFVVPNTKPVVDTKAQVEYIRQKSKSLPVNILPIGAVTKNAEGKELAEMYDMQRSGAIAFSDGTNPIQSPGLLLKALQYVKAFGGTIIQVPDDTSIGANGLMNEGIISTQLGLPGKPMMAEELIIARDIKLARYTGSKIHFTGVTSPKSLEYIRRAKDSGLHVTCSVTPYHLFFSDDDLTTYDTNLKVYPPLRTKKDVAMLRQAATDGTIDCVATHHFPHEADSKVLEFEYAKFGMTGLETCYAALNTVLSESSQENLCALLGTNTRKIFNLPQHSIREGEKCCLTLFDPSAENIVRENQFNSKSQNTPFPGKTLKGKVIGIVNGETINLNDQDSPLK